MRTIGQIKGYVTTATEFGSSLVTVRYTSDKIGKTLSLEANGVMISVAYEDIEKIIRKAK